MKRSFARKRFRCQHHLAAARAVRRSPRLIVRTYPSHPSQLICALNCRDLGSNRLISLLQPFPHRRRRLFLRSSQPASCRSQPQARNTSLVHTETCHLDFRDSQLLTAFSVHKRKGQANCPGTAENVGASPRGLLECGANRPPEVVPAVVLSSAPFVLPVSTIPHPAVSRTASYP